jgi:hypothetical protein
MFQLTPSASGVDTFAHAKICEGGVQRIDAGCLCIICWQPFDHFRMSTQNGRRGTFYGVFSMLTPGFDVFEKS